MSNISDSIDLYEIKKRRNKKIFGLFVMTGITMIVLIVETYAWFIGTGTSSVNSFSIAVSAGENLELSIDGKTWSETISISEESIIDDAYEGNTNHWTGEVGLVPISSNGDVDATVGRLKLFGKSSLTATGGGFRLISTRIDNYSTDSENSGIVEEKDGYVVFDLFVKNGTGPDYLETYDEESDEAIYLSSDSSVIAKPEGTEDFGLANSVRIAFTQVGRIASTITDDSEIAAISCGTSAVNNLSLCDKVDTAIWEPNDKNHDAKLIEYFTKVCKKKTVSGETISYNTACDAVSDGTAVNTYVVSKNLTSADNVDIYDGINGYETSDLVLQNAFTDTMKLKTGDDRDEIFKLGSNSITKLRVYIYLEGQDVDNYDLITNGKKIEVKFGFTKDKYDLASTILNKDSSS